MKKSAGADLYHQRLLKWRPAGAAMSGELNDVLLALNLSPLIHSDRDAEQLAREMILAHEKWLPNFAATIEKLKQ